MMMSRPQSGALSLVFLAILAWTSSCKPYFSVGVGSPIEDGGTKRLDGGAVTELDSGVLQDAGSTGDGGQVVDSGSSIDAGSEADAGGGLDGGNAPDAGLTTDAGEELDAGEVPDASLIGSWSGSASNTTQPLNGVWGSGPDDVWAVGDGVILHWDGGSWADMEDIDGGNLVDVWGSGMNDVWAVGGTTTLNWNGSSWGTVANPLNGGGLTSVWGSNATDVWVSVAAAASSMMHWNGTAWSLDSLFATDLRGVSGSNSNDVWAVGYDGMCNWNGATWSMNSVTGTFYGVFSVNTQDTWAVGVENESSNGIIAHWGGTAWINSPSGASEALYGVWGSASNNVWAVGAAEQQDLAMTGTILHWDGATWTQVPSGTDNTLTAVWGSSASDVWAVGNNGTILHWPEPRPDAGPVDAGRSDAGEPTDAGRRHDAGPEDAGLDGASQLVFIVEPSDVVAGVSIAPAIIVAAEYPDGGVVAATTTPITLAVSFGPTSGKLLGTALVDAASGIATFADLHLHVAGNYQILATSPGLTSALSIAFTVSAAEAVNLTFSTQPSEVLVNSDFSPSVAVTATDTYGNTATGWTTGISVALFANPGSAMLGGTVQQSPAGGAATFDDLTVSAPGSGYTIQANSGALPTVASAAFDVNEYGPCAPDGWCNLEPLPQGGPLNAVWGSSATDVWSVGGQNGISLADAIMHWDGTDWSSSPSWPTNDGLTSVWGSGADDVWAVASVGSDRILHWGGTAWSPVSVGPVQGLRSVWGSGTDDVWAVGDGGTALHWSGSSWSTISTGTTFNLYCVWGISSDDVWAVSDGGLTLHWNGISWTSLQSVSTNSFYGLWGSSTSNVWAVGEAGSVMNWNGGSWATVSSGEGDTDLLGVWGSEPDDIWAVGNADPGNGPGIILHWDGTSWSNGASQAVKGLYGVWGSSATDIWAVGGNTTETSLSPTILHL